MRLPEADELAHLSHEDRFKAVLKRVANAKPEAVAATEAAYQAERATQKPRGPRKKTDSGQARP